MSFNKKKVFIIIAFLCLFFAGLTSVLSNNDSIKIVYITDLNLYPTPSSSQRVKHILEKKDGLLLFESQAVFQEIIRYINQKLNNSDIFFFFLNNISKSFISADSLDPEELFHLFLDMASEIKTNILLILGENEIQTQKPDEVLRALNSYGLGTKNYYWSYKIKGFLLIGLEITSFFNSTFLAKNQLKWFEQTLNQNKDLVTLVFIHKPLISPDGRIIENANAKKYFKVLEAHPQVVLTVSGNEYLSRTKVLNKSVYALSASPVAFPCAFKLIEVTPNNLKIKSINIPLKGVIKKAEAYLVESERALSMFPSMPKLIKKYVLGDNSDSSFEVSFTDLRNR